MITTFNLSADELDLSILKSIKEAFKGRTIEIVVADVQESSSIEVLLKRIENLKKDKHTVTFSQDKFFKTYRKKIADASN